MVYTELPLDDVRAHRTTTATPPDLVAFWSDTLAGARAVRPATTWTRVDTGLRAVDTWDVRFGGFGGEPVAAWLHLPAGDPTGLACVVRYVGYGGGRGLPHESVLPALAGHATLQVDTRGQGGTWSTGDTPDPHGSASSHPGFMTRGIGDPATYYHRRLMTDAVLAVDAARDLPGVDASRVVVAGASQGGGLAIAAAALADDVAGAVVDVPFLCESVRAVGLTDEDPYGEVRRYLAVHRDAGPQVERTLALHDGTVLAALATAPATFSVALMDAVCPPSTVYAAYHAWAGPATITEYPWSGHEGGGAHRERQVLDWLADLVG